MFAEEANRDESLVVRAENRCAAAVEAPAGLIYKEPL